MHETHFVCENKRNQKSAIPYKGMGVITLDCCLCSPHVNCNHFPYDGGDLWTTKQDKGKNRAR